MKKYTFTVVLSGFGDNPHEAWRNTKDSTELDEIPIPYHFDVEDAEFDDFDPLP